MSYLQQRTWADQFNGQLNVACEDFIYSQRLLDITTKLSNPVQDQRQGIDAISTASGITWAFRVRKSNAARYFDNELTLRYVEFDKLISGNYASYLLYGLESPSDALKLSRVKLINMDSAAKQLRQSEELQDKILATEISYNSSENSFLCLRYSFFDQDIRMEEAVLSPYNSSLMSYPSQPIATYGKAPRISLKLPSLAP